MGELLSGLDRNIFFLVNNLPHNAILNSFFSLLSGIGSWGIVWLVILVVLFTVEEIEDKRCFLSLILAVVLSLILCDFLIKNIVQRPRPAYILHQIVEVGDTRRDFSFPSGHTTLSFAGAYVLALHHKKLKKYYFILAFLIAFSRIYLGKHFPSDILGGIALGLAVGYISDRMTRNLSLSGKKSAEKKQFRRKKK